MAVVLKSRVMVVTPLGKYLCPIAKEQGRTTKALTLKSNRLSKIENILNTNFKGLRAVPEVNAS